MKKTKPIISFPKTKTLVNAYLCRDGIETMAIWLGKRKGIHHVADGLDTGEWEEKPGRWLGTIRNSQMASSDDWRECEIEGDVAHSEDGQIIPKSLWPAPGKCVAILLEQR